MLLCLSDLQTLVQNHSLVTFNFEFYLWMLFFTNQVICKISNVNPKMLRPLKKMGSIRLQVLFTSRNFSNSNFKLIFDGLTSTLYLLKIPTIQYSLIFDPFLPRKMVTSFMVGPLDRCRNCPQSPFQTTTIWPPWPLPWSKWVLQCQIVAIRAG